MVEHPASVKFLLLHLTLFFYLQQMEGCMNQVSIFEGKELLTREDLKSLGIWLSNVTLLRLEACGRFPRRVRLSASSVCWLREEVLLWVEAKKEERARYHYADLR